MKEFLKIIDENIEYFKNCEDSDGKARDTVAGLEDIKAGRVIDGDKVLAWMKSWGTENELPPPVCK